MAGRDRASRPFGLRVLGSEADSVGVRRLRVQGLLTTAIVVANVVGALVVVALNLSVVPGPRLIDTSQRTTLIVMTPVYITAAVLVGAVWGTRRELPRLRWATTDAEPSPEDRRAALAAPSRLLVVQAALWLVALLLFGLLALSSGGRVLLRTTTTVALGGVVTCTFSYLLSEIALRPVAARALAPGAEEDLHAPGLARRTAVVWLVGTGVPVSGLILIALVALSDEDPDGTDLAHTILGLGGITLVVSAFLLWLATRAILDPLRAVRDGLAQVERGDLATRTVVYDGSELGRLQAAFNQMTAGLEERERLRDLFERHVGGAVADEALERGARLGGEHCEATALFVDLVGSTTLAERADPAEVVGVLNAFFEHVVQAVGQESGWVNKFEGDAALCVFGPPQGTTDHASSALRAARDLRHRLEGLARAHGIEAGIGLSSGAVIAGNVGAHQRFEYTVIGDPVNAASRLTDLAKDAPGHVLVDERTVTAASDDEQRHWQRHDEVVLRGRAASTVTYVLADPVPPPAR